MTQAFIRLRWAESTPALSMLPSWRGCSPSLSWPPWTAIEMEWTAWPNTPRASPLFCLVPAMERWLSRFYISYFTATLKVWHSARNINWLFPLILRWKCGIWPNMSVSTRSKHTKVLSEEWPSATVERPSSRWLLPFITVFRIIPLLLKLFSNNSFSSVSQHDACNRLVTTKQSSSGKWRRRRTERKRSRLTQFWARYDQWAITVTSCSVGDSVFWPDLMRISELF